MKNHFAIAAVAFFTALSAVSSVVAEMTPLGGPPVAAGVSILYVGANPFGIPSTGGTGIAPNPGPVTATVEKTFTSLGDIPMILHSVPQPGIVQDPVAQSVQFLHIDERVRNNTGVAWTDFHFTMTPIDANPLLQVEFQNVSNPTGQWTSNQSGVNFLSLFGSVANGDTFSLSFDLKVTSVQGSFDLFAIHEFPTVPSPSASVLAMLGCSILGAISRPRGRRVSA